MGTAGITILALLLLAASLWAAAREAGLRARDTEQPVSSDGRDHSKAIPLTQEELAWLREHPILRLGVDPAWPPYELIDPAGRYSGIAADYVRLISGRLGIAMEVQPGLSWEQVLAGLREKELDVSPAITLTHERSRFLLFTQPHIKYSVAIVTRSEHGTIDGLTALAGRNVALVKGYAFTELALASQPDIVPIYVDTVLEGLNKVSNGEAEAIVSDLPSLSYRISEFNFLNLKVAGIAPFETEGLRMGVRSDWPILVSILDKALGSITPEDHQQIRQRWVSVGAAESAGIGLSPEEQQWLANHPVIRNAADPAWAPIELVDENGRLSGITSEYLSRLEQMLHVKFETPWEMSWAQMMDALKDGRLDMASCVRDTVQRRSFMEFTEPYISMPTAIFARTDVNYVDLPSLKGQPVAVVEGYALQELLSEEYPEILLVPVRNLEQGLTMLSSGNVYAYVDALAPGSYGLSRHGFTNIHVAGETPFRYEMSMAASKQQPILASILQKAVRAIPEAERDRFFQKWATVPVTYRPDYSLIWRILAGGAFLLLIFIYWNRRLSIEVAARSRVEAELRQAKEELELRVAERTAELAARNVALAEEVLERGRAEEALRESEERFSKAFALSPAPMVISDMDTGRFIDVNEQWLRMLEHTREETIGHTSYEQQIWENPEVRTRLGRRLKETGSFGDEPIRFITKSGVIKDALWSAEKVNLGGAEVMLSLIYDFSERKRAEGALRAKTEELDRFFSVALDLLCIADTEGRFIRLNPQWQAVLGYPLSELEGSRFLDLVHPDDLEATLEALSRLATRESVLDFTNRYRCSDGSYRWIEWRSFPAGNLVYAAARDITERKKVEEALNEKNHFITSLLRAIPVAVFYKDKEGRYLGCNDAFTKFMGVTADDIRGKTVYELWPGEHAAKYHEMDLELMQNQGHQEYEFEVKANDGEAHPVLFAKDVYLDDNGEVAGLVGAFLDITELKQAEEVLRVSLLEKESLLKEVHHRVKNNLQVISSLLHLQARKVQNAEVHGFLRDTQNRVRSMALLHETLYQSGNLAKVRLPQYIKNVCTAVARSYASGAGNIQLHHEIADMSLDLDQAIPVGLIISELVSNAFKHAFPSQAEGEILVQLHEEENRLVLRVSDNGIGFPPGTAAQGEETLGLLLVRNLCRQLEGRLSIASGHGTVFEIVFPAQPT